MKAFSVVIIAVLSLAGMIQALRLRKQLPCILLDHWWAALAWTLIVLCATISRIDSSSSSQDLIPVLFQFAAGWAMVFSWRDLYRRRQSLRVETDSRHDRLRTLILRTPYGPISVLLAASILPYACNFLVDAAVARRDIVTIALLRHYGFSANNAGASLSRALWARDLPGMCASMEAVDSDGDRWCKQRWPQSEALDHRATTDILLRYSEDRNSDALVAAVGAGNTGRASSLLKGSVDVNHYGWSTGNRAWFTPLELAEKRRDTPMIRLLKDAGARESTDFAMRSE